MKQNLTIKDFHVTTYVTWEELESVLGKRRYNKFKKWIDGQTCVAEGVFPWDLERFLRNLPVID